MKFAASVCSIASVMLGLGSVYASTCENGGTLVTVDGDIHNNVVELNNPNGYGNYTSGVFHIRLDGGMAEYNCTLLGEPLCPYIDANKPEKCVAEKNINKVPAIPNPHQYHHSIVCDDPLQSELHFKTGFDSFFQSTGGFLAPGDYTEEGSGQSPVLTEEEIQDYCPWNSIIWFVETAAIDPSKKEKGLFQNATGSLHVGGCVTLAPSLYSDVEIGMGVHGEWCLTEWY